VERRNLTPSGGLTRFWHEYQNAGVTDDLTVAEARCVRTLNGMVLIVTGLLWLQLPFVFKLLPQTTYILASWLLWPLLWQLVPRWNREGRYTAARLFFSLSSMALIAFNAVQLAPVTENHLFMLTAALSGFIIYPPRDRRWLVLVVALALASLVGLEWFYRTHGSLIDFPPEFLDITRWSSMSALATVILGVTAHHYKVVTETERKLKLANQQLSGLLERDPLTSVYNRRKFETLMAEQASRGQPFGLIILDIDHFKRINDTHGHEAGDRVLVRVAQVAGTDLPSGYYLTRFGGEEFVFVLERADLVSTAEFAEQVRVAIEGHQFPLRDAAAGDVTASLGVAHFPSHTRAIDEILEAADTALYQAKAEGRNRVVVAPLRA
jgi:diguanylate cyclase (GGDEF)-like protein